jgi:hypothetical protein
LGCSDEKQDWLRPVSRTALSSYLFLKLRKGLRLELKKKLSDFIIVASGAKAIHRILVAKNTLF